MKLGWHHYVVFHTARYFPRINIISAFLGLEVVLFYNICLNNGNWQIPEDEYIVVSVEQDKNLGDGEEGGGEEEVEEAQLENFWKVSGLRINLDGDRK